MERIATLNTATSQLWRVDGTNFKRPYRIASNQPIAALLKELKLFILTEEAKVCIYDLLEIRLHMKWPGSDYRRYETIYTGAMVTAM